MVPFLVIVSTGHLAWAFLRLIYITIPTGAVRDINDIDSGGWDGAFSSLFSDAFVAVFCFFFSGLLNSLFDMLEGCWSSFFDLRLRFFSLRIFYRGFLIASFVALDKLFLISNALVHFPEYGRG